MALVYDFYIQRQYGYHNEGKQLHLTTVVAQNKGGRYLHLGTFGRSRRG